MIDGVIDFKDWNVFHNIMKTFDNLMIMGINVRNNDKKDKVIFEGINEGHTVVCKVVVDMEQLNYFTLLDDEAYIPVKNDTIVQDISTCIKHDMLKRICFHTKDDGKYLELYCGINGYLNEFIDDAEEKIDNVIYDNLKNNQYVKSKLRTIEIKKICDILYNYFDGCLKIAYDVEDGHKLRFSVDGEKASFFVDAVNTNKSGSNHVLVFMGHINDIMKNITSEYVTFYINKDDIVFIKTSKMNGVKYVFSIAPMYCTND